MIILDTNVLSELIKPIAATVVVNWLDQQPQELIVTTAISKAEMLVGAAILPDGKRKQQLSSLIESLFIDQFDNGLLPFDSDAATAFADIISVRRNMGRPIGTMDAQIAAIARSGGARIATRDTTDFEACGVELIDPWSA